MKTNFAVKRTLHKMIEAKQKVWQNDVIKFRNIQMQITIFTEELAQSDSLLKSF